jgi:hypothetical protein
MSKLYFVSILFFLLNTAKGQYVLIPDTALGSSLHNAFPILARASARA